MSPIVQDLAAAGAGGAPSGTRLRVVHVVHSFETGGLEKGVATLARHAAPDIEHVILCLARSGASARMLPAGTAVIEMEKAPGHSLRFIGKLSRRLKRLRPDVVHTRNWPGMDGILAARLAGIRGVVHGEHGWGTEDTYGRNPKRIRVRRALSRWVREYTCVSRQMIDWLRDEVGIRKPVTQIYNGIDTSVYRPDDGEGAALRGELEIPRDSFVVGVVGRLDPIKDHRSLLSAFAAFRARAPEAVLLVVGDGPERDRLAAAAGDAGESVRFLGDRADVPRLLRALDLFVLPSLNEGISNTIMEAMASALPVVATGVGGNPELIEDQISGTLIPAGDPAAIEAALLRYHSDRERRVAHGATACRLVRERFSTDVMTSTYENVWRRVAGRTADPPPATDAPRRGERR